MPDHSNLSRRDFLKTASVSAIVAGAAGRATAQDAKLEHRNEQPDVMRYTRLGRTNLNVSVIGFGAMFISTDMNNVRIIDMALERGVNYVDTAWAYTKHQSETEIGNALSGKRDKFFLTTKVSPYRGARMKMLRDFQMKMNATEKRDFRKKVLAAAIEAGAKEEDLKKRGRNHSKRIFGQTQGRMLDQMFGSKLSKPDLVAAIEKSLEESLTRLKTDHVDVLFLPHGLDSPDHARYEDVHEGWAKIKKSGKARFLGAPNHTHTVATYDACIETGIYDVLMPCYCPLNYNRPEDQDSVLKRAKEKDLGVVAMKTTGSKARDTGRFKDVLGGKTFAEKVAEVVKGEGTPFQKSIAWVLSRPHIDMALVGISNQQELDEDLGALNVKLA
ncbi:MAG: aldo/keto reductase [Planctomycetes bacterium]|nr:aldo/keto reductase [Planctomycetota bacterium]